MFVARSPPPWKVAQKVRPVKEILELSRDCWFDLDRKTFESSWIVCGYFGSDHFVRFRESVFDGIDTFEEAIGVIDPAEVLAGSSLSTTPQYCTAFEWQIKEIGKGRNISIATICHLYVNSSVISNWCI